MTGRLEKSPEYCDHVDRSMQWSGVQSHFLFGVELFRSGGRGVLNYVIIGVDLRDGRGPDISLQYTVGVDGGGVTIWVM